MDSHHLCNVYFRITGFPKLILTKSFTRMAHSFARTITSRQSLRLFIVIHPPVFYLHACSFSKLLTFSVDSIQLGTIYKPILTNKRGFGC